LIVDKLFIDNKIILIENSIKIIDNYLLLIKLVIDNQEKSMKTRFHRRLLINNRLKKLNTATLIAPTCMQHLQYLSILWIQKLELS
jgi:hypothetical protein